MSPASAICLYCSEPVKAGRSDKKFCDSTCKDAYYNAVKSKEQAEISKIDGILKKNRRVLQKLFDPKKPDKIFTREEMIRTGFEFGFMTHIVVTKGKGLEIVFCYDYGFREDSENCYLLFHSFENVQVKDGYKMKVK